MKAKRSAFLSVIAAPFEFLTLLAVVRKASTRNVSVTRSQFFGWRDRWISATELTQKHPRNFN